MNEWIECEHGVKIEYCRTCAADHFQKRAAQLEAENAALREKLEQAQKSSIAWKKSAKSHRAFAQALFYSARNAAAELVRVIAP